MRSPELPLYASLETTIGGVTLVIGFRPELLGAVAPDAAPPEVVGFNEPLVGQTGYVLPATQHDVGIWLTGSRYDTVFDLSGAPRDRRASGGPHGRAGQAR